MREAIHCPFCELLLVALDEVDLFIVLCRHLDAEHDALHIPEEEIHQFITYLACQVV